MSEAGPAPLRGRRLLVVEDEYLIAAEIAHTLESLGVVVLGPTATVAGARRLIEGADGIDGALLDINLRGDPVYPIADLLRSRDLPFLFATGYEARVIPRAYADVPRCEKPVSTAAIADVMAGLLRPRGGSAGA